MAKPLTAYVLVIAVLALTAGAASSLGAPGEQAVFPSALVGRWSRTITHAAWLKHGREFPTTKVTLEVDRAGKQIGYFGPDFQPTPQSVTGKPSYPDWYTEWRVAGSKVTIGAVPPCGWIDTWKGSYRWTVSGKTLTISKVADKCPDRQVIFAGTWKRR